MSMKSILKSAICKGNRFNGFVLHIADYHLVLK